jgi:ATP-dependent DNA ligase
VIPKSHEIRRLARCSSIYPLGQFHWPGQDLRSEPLMKRKRALRQLLKSYRSKLIKEVLFVQERRVDLFDARVRHDVEGIVAKCYDGAYTPTRSG